MSKDDINNGVYRFGDFELNSGERTLVKNGLRVAVTPRAFDLLLALVRADGHLLTKETLLDQVWADAIVEEGNLNRTISALRKALGEARGESRYIETVPKSGYRFVAPLSRDASNGDRSASLGSMEPAAEPATANKVRSYNWLFGLGAFFLLFGALAAAYVLVPRPEISNKTHPQGGMVRLTDNQFNEDHAEWTADNQIRFVRYVSNTRAESWVMNADGSGQRRANDRIKSLLTGGWSPDGKRVVFIKEGEGPENVYLADSDGANERKLPLSYPPSDWSPDGTKFVYATAVAEKANSEIFIYDIETSKSVNITNNPAFDVDPLFSPDGREIAFVSSRAGNSDDYIMAIDGSNVRRLTDHAAIDAFPAFSPDGTQIVFDSNRRGENIDIYIKNVNDGSQPINLTDLPSNEEHRGRCWSPDGTKMVITSDQGGKNNIYVLGVEAYRPTLYIADGEADLQHPAFSPDGTKLAYQAKYDDKSLAVSLIDLAAKGPAKTIFRTAPNIPNHALAPVFSPDGGQIVFTNKVAGNSEVYSMDLAGKGLVNLSNNEAADALPVFSPDGRTIFFQSNRDGNFERFSIFRMNADGSDQRRVTEKEGYEFSPVPFPTGSRLVFSGDRLVGPSRSLDIRVVDADAPENETVIAERRFHDSQPAVSPDGSRIAFVAQSDGNREIYLANADGTGLVRLTRDLADDVTPRFSTDGSSLFFSSDRGGRYAIYELKLFPLS